MPLANASSVAIGLYFALLVIASLISFFAYGWDKFRAKRDGRRLSERTLHLIDVFGGWPGGLLARRTFRHKTVKRSYIILFWITVVVHLLAVFAIASLWVRLFSEE
ncbi:MAG: DUF1294 domain-containing protein [Planctomycetota bacterium]